jgi:hypothetical protein
VVGGSASGAEVAAVAVGGSSATYSTAEAGTRASAAHADRGSWQPADGTARRSEARSSDPRGGTPAS